MYDHKPLISIITVVLNGEKHLASTIKSVVNQTYKNIEYIIIDGGSTDGTLDIIKEHQSKIDYWISEKDKGISDAFNKGVKAAKGDYLNFQGDGDGFICNSALENVFDEIDSQKDILISTRVQRVDIDGKKIFTSKYIKNFHKQSLLFRMSLPHQGLFTHASFFSKFGLFDTNYRYCMDYDHLLRAYKEFPRVLTKDIITAIWRADGIGNDKALEIFKEYDKTKRNNKILNNIILLFINYWILFKHFVKVFFVKPKC
jgi:glycosyltransferase involved in cell wall biosynthesis